MTLVVNLVSAPRAGKTTLLARTIERLRDRLRVAVVVSDSHRPRDTDRLRRSGVPVLTAASLDDAGSCGLELPPTGAGPGADRIELLFTENVGRARIAELDEIRNVLLVSVTEGEDPARGCPEGLRYADALVVTKIDLIPYGGVAPARIVRNARAVRPRLRAFPISCYTGEGLEEWVGWVAQGVAGRPARGPDAG